jgi:hypothetical protein
MCAGGRQEANQPQRRVMTRARDDFRVSNAARGRGRRVDAAGGGVKICEPRASRRPIEGRRSSAPWFGGPCRKVRNCRLDVDPDEVYVDWSDPVHGYAPRCLTG